MRRTSTGRTPPAARPPRAPLRIEALVPGGRGLTRDDDGVILVQGGLPGDLVTVERVVKKGGARLADVATIVEPSSMRVTPDCDAAATCGGCDLLGLSSSGQVAARLGIVTDALRRIARLDDDELARVAPLVPAPLEAGARRRVALRVDARGRAGFSPRASHDVVPRRACLAVAPRLEVALGALAALPARTLPPAARVRLAVDDRGRVSAALSELPAPALVDAARALVDAGVAHGCVVVDDEGEIVAEHGDVELQGEVAPGHPRGPFSSDAACFTQATRAGAVRITDAVVAAVDGALAPGADLVLELFAGAGHLTFPLVDLGADVIAVEGAPRSVHWLVRNIDRAGTDRVRAVLGHIDGTSFLRDYHELLPGPPDVLVADPPRTGIPDLRGLLTHLRPARLVLVSCDVATGARDLAIARREGYALRSLVPIDAFPRTSHVEWVARLDLAE